MEEVCVNENKCPLIVEVSPGSGLRLKFISVCQLRLKSGKYQVSHHRESHDNYDTFCHRLSISAWTGGEEVGESEIELCL